jgi:hypothetical protein
LQQTLSGDTLDADVTPLACEPGGDVPPADEEFAAALEIELVDESLPTSARRGAERRGQARSP